MLTTTIRVQVVGKVHEYPAMIEEYGDWIAAGGATLSLYEAQQQARAFWAANRGDIGFDWVSFWAMLDDSGLAYHVEINRRGTHRAMGAAPLPGPGNVREMYVA